MRWEKWRKANPEQLKCRYERYKQTHGDDLRKRWRAAFVVKAAIRDGRLAKPSQCNGCGHSFPLPKIQAHHEDYSKPLVVIWLCHRCHTARHRGLECMAKEVQS